MRNRFLLWSQILQGKRLMLLLRPVNQRLSLSLIKQMQSSKMLMLLLRPVNQQLSRKSNGKMKISKCQLMVIDGCACGPVDKYVDFWRHDQSVERKS